MMKNKNTDNYDVVIIGGGPAGLSAAIEAHKNNARVLLLERDTQLGGILNQCIHDGFGIVKFNQRMTGPEYAQIFIDRFYESNIDYLLNTFVESIKEETTSTGNLKILTALTPDGIKIITTKSVVFAMGCRERTSKQILIAGDRPAGVYTAGLAQNFVNIMGYMVGKNIVILGSGDIGLIMARRLTLEGANVLGVYEIQPIPSGLERNIQQCLIDYDIPLCLSHTVTEIIGQNRIKGIKVCKVDEKMNPIFSTEKEIACDTLILSVGLIPENDLPMDCGFSVSEKSKGLEVDQNMHSIMKKGYFSCGNVLHVNDLVDYVSESAETAGYNAALYTKGQNNKKKLSPIKLDSNFLYLVPHSIDRENISKDLIFYFRAKQQNKNVKFTLYADDSVIAEKKLAHLKPSEMVRIQIKKDAVLGLEDKNTIFSCTLSEC